jgi:hypothetical protein
MAVFLNGTSYASGTNAGTITYTCPWLGIGGAFKPDGNINVGSGSSQYPGNISDPIFHNRALSPAEIQILANRSDPMLGGLVLPPRRKLYLVKPSTTFFPVKIRFARRSGSSVASYIIQS